MERRVRRERGSALLIVFVFAAMLAIMLYKEMPVAAFEAQRQKEELLMDRGNEYKRAIKLYVRKFQTFPPSLEALENTNRMRFLRNRYADPFTGKSDWRILHAGPGGIITDSKIKQKTLGANGAPGSSPGATSASSSFGGFSAFGSGNAEANAPAPAAANTFPQRPPATGMAGGGSDLMPGMPVPGPSPESLQEPPQQSDTPPVPAAAAVPYPGYPGPPTAAVPSQTNSATDTAQPVTANPLATSSAPYPVSTFGRFRSGSPTGNSLPPAQMPLPGDPAAQQRAAGNPQDPQAMMQALLNNQGGQPNAQTGAILPTAAARSTFGNNARTNNTLTTGGGIAGVASKSGGHTIKILNDQTERTLWEFVYDMRQEALANAPGLGGTGQPGTGTNGSPNGAPNPGASTGFGGQPSAFGSNPGQTGSSFGGGFGSNQAPVMPRAGANQ